MFQPLVLKKLWFAKVTLGITVRNKVPERKISPRISFLTIFSRKTCFIARISPGSLFFYLLILKNMGRIGSAGNIC
jgi:hypothetical protein